MAQQVLQHEPTSAEVRAYYLAKGRVLAGSLRKGMTDEAVLGVRANGWFGAGEWWTDITPCSG